ncbi:MAG: DUF1735 domain-containing protein [Bacteroidota bacterium]|nr:DUF1735 domain-containing protein [Bacteroidota bacterium]
MIRIKKNLLIASLVFVATVVLFSCVKEKTFFPTATGDASRKQIVTVTGGDVPIVVIARNVSPSIDSFVLIEIRRNPSTQAELNSPLTVKITKNDALRTAYNTKNGTSYVDLPAGSYSVLGDLNAITFQPGEFVKEIKIRLDKSQLNLSNQYAIGFSVTEAGGGGQISSSMKNVLYSVGIKNQYDGTYTLKGAFYHPTQSPGYDRFTVTVEMHTSGPNSVKMYSPDIGGYYHPGLFAGVLNAFGSQEPNYTIDPVTNKVTVQNSYVGAVTFYTMAPGYDSRYDPATRTIYAKFGYNYAAGPTFNPATNREWTDTLIYVGPR